MRKLVLGLALVGVLSLFALAQGIYPVYYDCSYPSGGMESATRLYVVNPNDTGVQYTVSLYTTQGVLIGTGDFFVNSGAANHIWLPDLIVGDRTHAWGLCVVDTWLAYPTELHVVAERYIAGTLTAYDVVPDYAVSGYHTFFYNAWHSAGGPDNDTHMTVMNPTDTANGYYIELYDANGNSLGMTRGIVNPKRTNVHRMSDLISGSRDFTWGLCIVRSEMYAYEEFAVNIFRMRDGRILGTETIGN